MSRGLPLVFAVAVVSGLDGAVYAFEPTAQPSGR